jgi:hypothetical protein
MTALATLDQLTERVTSPITDPERALAVIDDVSAAVRSYTGRHITASEHTERLRPHGLKVRLSQSPVTVVSAVTNMAGSAVPFSWDGLEVVRLSSISLVAFDRDALITNDVVDVVYEAGYVEVPDDVVGVVCNVVARALSGGPEIAGVTQEAVAGYSVSFGSVGASGPLGFFAAELRVLDAYTRPSTSWAGSP